MKPRILVVDDEPDFLQLLEFNLSRSGYDVAVAATGLEALRRARNEAPQVIILDMMLPDLDGFSVCEILRAQPSTRQVPVIILSALDRPAGRARGARLNVSCWLKKGVEFSILSESIRAAIGEHQASVKAHLEGDEPELGNVGAVAI